MPKSLKSPANLPLSRRVGSVSVNLKKKKKKNLVLTSGIDSRDDPKLFIR